MTEKETDLQAAPEDEVQQETLQEELQEETDAPLDDEEEAEEAKWGVRKVGRRRRAGGRGLHFRSRSVISVKEAGLTHFHRL